MIYSENGKIDEKGNLKCVCGSIRTKVRMYDDDDGNKAWVLIYCGKCRKTLYYNGA